MWKFNQESVVADFLNINKKSHYLCTTLFSSIPIKMPIANDEIISLLCTLAEEERLRVTIRQSLKGGVIAGGMAAAGGLLLGPIGLAVGGSLGGCLAAALCRDSFLPAAEVIANMSVQQRNQLSQNVRNIVQNVNATDIAMLGAMVAGDISVRNRIMTQLLDYLRTEMALAIVDG